jgi:trimethylamine:corrinoid methyltransferase-like protein
MSPQAGTAHRQRGGRQKRVERALSGQVGGPALLSARFPFTPPEEEQLERMEAAADRILAEIGMDIRVDAEALSLFRAAGPRKRRVRSSQGWSALCVRAGKVSPSMLATRVRSRSAAMRLCATRGPSGRHQRWTRVRVTPPVAGVAAHDDVSSARGPSCRPRTGPTPGHLGESAILH